MDYTQDTYVEPKKLIGKSKTVTAVTIEEKEDKKQINGLWIPTGYKSLRATIDFSDGTWTRSKSSHLLTKFSQAFGKTEKIPRGFRTEFRGGKNFAFFTSLTRYSNGETYDVIDVVEDD